MRDDGDVFTAMILGLAVGIVATAGFYEIVTNPDYICDNTWPGSFERGGKCVQVKEVE